MAGGGGGGVGEAQEYGSDDLGDSNAPTGGTLKGKWSGKVKKKKKKKKQDQVVT